MKNLKKKEIIAWLKADNPSKLFIAADKLRQKYFKNEVCLRGIIEFSNNCQKDCLFCGLRKSNKKLKRYQMNPGEIVKAAAKAVKLGYQTVLLQSGQESGYDVSSLEKIVKAIKKNNDCAVTLSLGEKSFQDYERLKKAGADRYLLRFETSSRELFKKLKPDSSYSNRIACLKNLKRIGFQVGSGIMVGLPGQTYQTLAKDILLLADLDLDMIGIGPFLPHQDTPLAGVTSGSLDLTLRTMALLRLLVPDAHIPATTAMGSVEKNGREKALSCGANVSMANLTPLVYRKHYQIYSNKINLYQKPATCSACLKRKLKSLGKTIALHKGDSIKKGFKLKNA